MGPKKGKGKAKEVIVGGYALHEMTPEELQEFAVKMEEEVEITRKERNFFQLERDRIVQFWEVTKVELNMKNFELLNREKEIEDIKLALDLQEKENKQKLKHLQFEYTKNLREHEIQKAADVRDADEYFRGEEHMLVAKIKDHEFSISQMKLNYEDLIRKMNLDKDEEINSLRVYYEKKLVDTIEKYETMMLNLQDAMDLQKRVEIHEIEDTKNSDIKTFMDMHSHDFERMQGYFKDITLKNLALITTLKEETERVKQSEEEMKNMLNKVMCENESLHHVKQEVVVLTRHLANYERDQISLSLARKRLTECSEKAQTLEYENEVLSQTLVNLKKQKEALHNQFVALLRNIQDRTGLKSVFLENKLKIFMQENNNDPSSFQEQDSDLFWNVEKTGEKHKKEVSPEERKSSLKKKVLPVTVVNVQFQDDDDVHYNPPSQLNEPNVDVKEL